MKKQIFSFFKITLVFITLTYIAGSSSALENNSYEVYCFESLKYFAGDVSNEFRIDNAEDALNNSIELTCRDTLIETMSLNNQLGNKTFKIYTVPNITGDSENHYNILFYYTDLYIGHESFFGCTLTVDNYPQKGVITDVTNTRIIGMGEQAQRLMNTRNTKETIDYTRSMSGLQINNVKFNIVHAALKQQAQNVEPWETNVTFLVTYMPGSPGKQAWDDYVKFRNGDMITSTDRDLIEYIKQNKTTYVNAPLIDPVPDISPVPETKSFIERVGYLRLSQMLAAILIFILLISLIMQKKRESDSWRIEE